MAHSNKLNVRRVVIQTSQLFRVVLLSNHRHHHAERGREMNWRNSNVRAKIEVPEKKILFLPSNCRGTKLTCRLPFLIRAIVRRVWLSRKAVLGRHGISCNTCLMNVNSMRLWWLIRPIIPCSKSCVPSQHGCN